VRNKTLQQNNAMLQEEPTMVTSENKLKKNPSLQIIPGLPWKKSFQKFLKGSPEKLSRIFRCNKMGGAFCTATCIAQKKKYTACVSIKREKE
jgi:hypothetical protein